MNKDQRLVVLEYSASLSEDALRNLTIRLTDKLQDDLSDSLNEMSKDRRMDTLFLNTESSEELFDLLDDIKDVFQKECRKKGLSPKV